ncbi:nuclease-related domain-containing protein [Malikia granosa]|uniref:NERD domain-containing protein n=1 Tax=Malikia granosa TaxID=263067 RepID=A0A2S9K8S3_9BURK|nr:nuclease-related domain-containing protein [Malikia granosa]PRD66792.1 hypothetical protein C6P64_01225 [Malikia granosa]
MSHPHATAHAPYASTSSEDIPWLFLDPRAYHRLGLVTIRHSGVTTRANHVIVSNYGIFVIEENSDSGSFQANPGINWTQYRDEQSIEIPNPVRQVSHEAHALQEALELPGSHFHAAVFFTSGQVYLKGEVPDNVISEGFTDYIKSFKKVILSDAEVNAIVNQLTQSKAASRPTQAAHHPAHHHPHEHHARHEPVPQQPAPPAPNRMKSLAYGLAALLLGALVTSAIFLWLN